MRALLPSLSPQWSSIKYHGYDHYFTLNSGGGKTLIAAKCCSYLTIIIPGIIAAAQLSVYLMGGVKKIIKKVTLITRLVASMPVRMIIGMPFLIVILSLSKKNREDLEKYIVSECENNSEGYSAEGCIVLGTFYLGLFPFFPKKDVFKAIGYYKKALSYVSKKPKLEAEKYQKVVREYLKKCEDQFSKMRKKHLQQESKLLKKIQPLVLQFEEHREKAKQCLEAGKEVKQLISQENT